MRRFIAELSSLLLLTVILHGQSKPYSKDLRSAPYTEQEVLLLLAGQSADKRILLTLNNNRPDKLVANLELYFLDGSVRTLPSMMLDASESRLFEFDQTLREANIFGRLGYLKIHYSGRNMELGAQLTLYPIPNGGGIDSPRSLRGDFTSTERHAVAWMPSSSRGVISLTNVSDSPIKTTISVSSIDETIVLQPNETILRERSSGELGSSKHSNLLSLDMSFSGPKDGIRAFGYIEGDAGENLPIRIYDPHSATGVLLGAVGLSIGNETHVAIRNLLERTVVVSAQLNSVGTKGTMVSSSTKIRIPGHTSVETKLLDMFPTFIEKGTKRATLVLKNDASPGALVGSVTQKMSSLIFEDIPLKSSNPIGFMRGAYPLRWQDDYVNRPMVANTSEEDAQVRAYVIAGGITYFFGVSTIKAGMTEDFDVDYLRANQIPDANGNIIPLTAEFGKFHWSPADRQPHLGLQGRTELKSILNRRASSFSCGAICNYEQQLYPYFDYDPFGSFPWPFVTGAQFSHATRYTFDGYGNNSGSDTIAYGVYGPMTSGSTSVLSYTPLDSDMTLRTDTGVSGDTDVVYHYYDLFGLQDEEGSSCNYPDMGHDITEASSVGTRAPLIQSSCTTGGGMAGLSGNWGKFGCSVGELVYSLSASESCVTSQGKYGDKRCARSNVNGCLTTTCPIDDRSIDSACTKFVDGLVVKTTTVRVNCP